MSQKLVATLASLLEVLACAISTRFWKELEFYHSKLITTCVSHVDNEWLYAGRARKVVYNEVSSTDEQPSYNTSEDCSGTTATHFTANQCNIQ